MTTKHTAGQTSRCCEQVATNGLWNRYHQCTRLGSVTRDGKVYCKTHDPVAIKERHNARDKKWQERSRREYAAFQLQAAASDLLSACEGLVRLYESKWGDEPKELLAARSAIKKSKL